MLDKVKARLGIDNSVTVYDAEISSLVQAAVDDILASGVPERLLGDTEEGYSGIDDRVLLAVVFYVKANYGDDRTNTTRYMDMYRKAVFRLTLEEGEP